MSEKRTTERGELYDKLTPQRKMLVDMILQNLDNGAGLWKQGWRTGGAPENAVTGKKYRGVNNMFLTFVSMLRGYSDNRWLTFNQMKERDWSFKTDAEGHSLGKKAGVSVEFFDLWDRETKKKFDRRVLDGMSFDERQEYMEENVYPIRKYYTMTVYRYSIRSLQKGNRCTGKGKRIGKRNIRIIITENSDRQRIRGRAARRSTR